MRARDTGDPLRIALFTFLCASALWSLGLFVTPFAGLLTLLLVVSTLLAFFAVWKARSDPFAQPALWSAVLVVMSMAAVGDFLHGLFGSPSPEVELARRVRPSEEPASRLRVVSFNVRHGYPGFRSQGEREAALGEALERLEPDLVILQEAWNTRRHGHLATRLGAALDLDVAWAAANGSLRFLGFEEGTAILSRHPILEAKRIVLEPPRPWWETRIAVQATLDLGGGTTFTAVGVHLTHHDTSIADRQARHLVSRLPDSICLVAGDFNAPSGGPAVAVFEKRGLEDVVPGGIDHVLAGAGGWRVADAGWTLEPRDLETLLGRRLSLSDHPGLRVDLVQTRAGGSQAETGRP